MGSKDGQTAKEEVVSKKERKRVKKEQKRLKKEAKAKRKEERRKQKRLKRKLSDALETDTTSQQIKLVDHATVSKIPTESEGSLPMQNQSKHGDNESDDSHPTQQSSAEDTKKTDSPSHPNDKSEPSSKRRRTNDEPPSLELGKLDLELNLTTPSTLQSLGQQLGISGGRRGKWGRLSRGDRQSRSSESNGLFVSDAATHTGLEPGFYTAEWRELTTEDKTDAEMIEKGQQSAIAPQLRIEVSQCGRFHRIHWPRSSLLSGNVYRRFVDIVAPRPTDEELELMSGVSVKPRENQNNNSDGKKDADSEQSSVKDWRSKTIPRITRKYHGKGTRRRRQLIRERPKNGNVDGEESKQKMMDDDDDEQDGDGEGGSVFEWFVPDFSETRWVSPSLRLLVLLYESLPTSMQKESHWNGPIIRSLWKAVLQASSEFNHKFRNRSEYTFILNHLQFDYSLTDCHYLPLPWIIPDHLMLRERRTERINDHNLSVMTNHLFTEGGDSSLNGSNTLDSSVLSSRIIEEESNTTQQRSKKLKKEESIISSSTMRINKLEQELCDAMKEPSYYPRIVNNEFHRLATLLRICPSHLVRDYLRAKYSVNRPNCVQIVSLLQSKVIGHCTSDVKAGLVNYQTTIRVKYKMDVDIPLNELYSMYVALMMDAVAGSNLEVAWFGFRERIHHLKTLLNEPKPKKHIRSQLSSLMKSMDLSITEFPKERLMPVLNSFTSMESSVGSIGFEKVLYKGMQSCVDRINQYRITVGQPTISVLTEEQQILRIHTLENLFLFDKLVKHELSLMRVGNESEKHSDEDGNEMEQRVRLQIKEASPIQRLTWLKRYQWKSPPTPDLVFSEPLVINNRPVRWMDAKHLVLLTQDKLSWGKTGEQAGRFTRFYGSGAVVPLAYFRNAQYFNNVSTLFLDCSKWGIERVG